MSARRKIRMIVEEGVGGCGKGTLSGYCEARSISVFETGKILRHGRKHDPDFPKEVARRMDCGQLVKDHHMVEIFMKFIRRIEALAAGDIDLILDGFPRTPRQAARLWKMIQELRKSYDVEFIAVKLDISYELAAERCMNRRKEALERGEKPRSDDEPHVVARRIRQHRRFGNPTWGILKKHADVAHVITIISSFLSMTRLHWLLEDESSGRARAAHSKKAS